MYYETYLSSRPEEKNTENDLKEIILEEDE